MTRILKKDLLCCLKTKKFLGMDGWVIFFIRENLWLIKKLFVKFVLSVFTFLFMALGSWEVGKLK